MSVSEDSEPIIAHWPGDWPGRQFIDLDCVGDPGWWIYDQIPSDEEVLMDDPSRDEETAEVLADAYIMSGRELHFPLPTDFGTSEEEMRKAAISDFLGFIREWRRRTLAERVTAREGTKE